MSKKELQARKPFFQSENIYEGEGCTFKSNKIFRQRKVAQCQKTGGLSILIEISLISSTEQKVFEKVTLRTRKTVSDYRKPEKTKNCAKEKFIRKSY